MERKLMEKDRRLGEILSQAGPLAVAFSSGVDSTFLLDRAAEQLGKGAIAISAVSAWVPKREAVEADAFCRERGIRHLIISLTEEEIPGFTENPPDRCYLCKKKLFSKLQDRASKEGFPLVVEGSNMDDLGDFRPGIRALSELGIRSPLREAGLYKAEIRELSRERNLPTFSKPSFACLASRFVYGEEITREKLSMVERAEDLLLSLGFSQMRVRIHGNLARIEVERGEIERIAAGEMRERISSALKEMGFAYVTLDLLGYRVGSMNEVLGKSREQNDGIEPPIKDI